MQNFVQAFRRSLAACALLALAGCVTVPNSLSTDDVRSFRYASTVVTFDPSAVIWWGDGERAYAATKGLSDEQAADAAKTPEGKAYLHEQVATRVKAAMDGRLAGKLNGTHSVRVEVVVKNVTIASVAQRVIIGGTHLMGAAIKLVDVQSGKVVATHPGLVAGAAAGQGIAGVVVDGMIADPPLDRVTRNLAEAYEQWLTASSPAGA